MRILIIYCSQFDCQSLTIANDKNLNFGEFQPFFLCKIHYEFIFFLKIIPFAYIIYKKKQLFLLVFIFT